MKASTELALFAGLGVGAALLAWYLGHRAAAAAAHTWDEMTDAVSEAAGDVLDAAGDALQAVNPTSDRNLAYRAANGLGAVITGDDDWTLGSAVYDWLHPGVDQQHDDADDFGSPTETETLTHPRIAPKPEGVRPGGDPYNGHPMPAPYYPWQH